MQRTKMGWLALFSLLACGQPASGTQPIQNTGGASSAGQANGGALSPGGAGAAQAGGVAASMGGATSGSGATPSSGGTPTFVGGAAGSAALTGGVSNGGVAGGGQAAGGASTPSGGSAGCPRACGPTFEQLFDEKKLATLRIKIAGADVPGFSEATWLDALWSKWSHCSPFSYVPSQMTYESPDGAGNMTLDKVGIRLRGSHMRGFTQTQGLKLDFQVLDTPGAAGKRRFGDLNRLNILSIETDPSHMVQCLAYKAMRDFGVPAPRCNFMKVYVNDKYYGLLEHVEQINKGYLRRHFGTNTGSLYAASPSMGDCANGFKDSQARLEYSGDKFSSYTTQYQLTHATATEAEQNLIPMLKCGDATQTPDDAAFKTCISDWIDVNEWLKLIAAESVLPELESFIGYYRNYYLYFKADPSSPHQGRFVIWPWDLDSSFDRGRCTPSDCNVLTSVSNLYRTSRAKLVQRLTTVFRSQYCTALNEFLSNVYKPSLVSDLAKVVEPGIMNEPTVSSTMWQSAVSALQNHITMQTSKAQASIMQACQ